MPVQPHEHVRRTPVEPSWRRFPGWRDVTREQWRDPRWQRVHCVRNTRQLRAVVGDLLDERFYDDLAADQESFATMSMLLPPQMLNTMVPEGRRTSPGRSTPTRCAGTCCRCGPTATPSGRATRTRHGTRCTRPRCGWWRA
nr:hypothetical protein GCM10017745_38690 [Saccharothrix mutabilis subsp. capreolus]